MKNFSKSNYSKNNNNKKKQKIQSKNDNKSNNFQEDRNSLSKNNNNFFERNKLKKSEDFKINEKNSYISRGNHNHNFQQRKSLLDISYTRNFSDTKFNKFQLNSNDRNFQDWIWGRHSVFATLNSHRPINRIWCTSEIYSSEKFFLLLKDLKSKGTLIEEVSWTRLSQLTHGAVHQGVALQVASSETISLKKLIEISKNKSPNPILVALDGITDPHNLGAIIRSAEAFDCKGIIIPQRRSAGLTGTVAKVAAGALEHIPVARVVNLNRALEDLKKNGFLSLGLAADGQIPISKFTEKAPLVVIVGAENKGISLLTQKHCDYLLNIPLKGKTSSLNASVAAAISLCYLSSK